MNPLPLAQLSENVQLAILALIGGIFSGMVTPVILFVLKDRSDTKARKEASDAAEKARLEAVAARQIINTKLDDNTALTQHHGSAILGLLSDALKVSNGNEIHTVVTIPAIEEGYVRFELSEGGDVFWRQEEFDEGKRCRFKITSEASMGFHSHPVSERLQVVSGTLLVESLTGLHPVGPGEKFTSPAMDVHKVSFTDRGEVVCDWLGQTSDQLSIVIYTTTPQ